jgi:hypothetical protein
MNIQRIFLEFIVGLVLAIITYLPVASFAFFLSALGVDFGRTTIILLALVLGYPVGSVLGILLVDRFFFKAKGWNVLGIGLSVVLGVMGGLGGLMMISRLGDYSLVIMPALIACLAVVGYNLVSLFKRN